MSGNLEQSDEEVIFDVCGLRTGGMSDHRCFNIDMYWLGLGKTVFEMFQYQYKT